jgi:transposase-like protein
MKCPDCGADQIAHPGYIRDATNATLYLCPKCKRSLLKECDCSVLLDCFDIYCPACGKKNPIVVTDNAEAREAAVIRELQ